MKEQLSLLEELQRYDARLQEFEATLKAVPEKLHSLKANLEKMDALLGRERAALTETERFRREQELSLKTDESGVARAKAKLTQVKTGKDHMAAQREMEATRKMVGEREEELVKLIDAIGASKKTIEAHEKDVAELRAHVEAEEKSANAIMDEVRGKAAAERSLRDVAAARVRPDVLKRYGAIRIRRGLAVVPVLKGTCQGCHMAIPPQLFNLLQRGNSIETCPTCARIIYWSEIMKDKALERGEADGDSASAKK